MALGALLVRIPLASSLLKRLTKNRPVTLEDSKSLNTIKLNSTTNLFQFSQYIDLKFYQLIQHRK